METRLGSWVPRRKAQGREVTNQQQYMETTQNSESIDRLFHKSITTAFLNQHELTLTKPTEREKERWILN